MTKYKPAFEKSSDYKFPEIDPDFILSVRKFMNIFEIRKAAQTATIPQLETAQFIWKTICLVIGQLGPEEQRSEIGLTPARRLQGAFGPLVQSLIVVALQTEAQAALVRIFELLAAGADQLETARECGVWTGHEGAQRFGLKAAPIPWSRWKVFGWNSGKGLISLRLRKNEELDHEKLGVFGSENSSAITSSGLRSPGGKICATGRRMKSIAKRNPKLTTPAIKSPSAWATRSELWQSRAEKVSLRRTKRAKPQSALILAGHGVSLRIHGVALDIKNGLTHYPQQRETYLFFRGDPDLPERIILLDGSGSVSFDVLSWLNEQNVSLIRIDWRGEIICVVGQSGYSANPFRVQWQLATRDNSGPRLEYCRKLISQKIEASILTLEKPFVALKNGSEQFPLPMRLSQNSTKNRRKQLSSCGPWKLTAPPLIFALGRERRLNGAEQAEDQSPTIGIQSSSDLHRSIWLAIAMPHIRSTPC